MKAHRLVQLELPLRQPRNYIQATLLLKYSHSLVAKQVVVSQVGRRPPLGAETQLIVDGRIVRTYLQTPITRERLYPRLGIRKLLLYAIQRSGRWLGLIGITFDRKLTCRRYVNRHKREIELRGTGSNYVVWCAEMLRFREFAYSAARRFYVIPQCGPSEWKKYEEE